MENRDKKYLVPSGGEGRGRGMRGHLTELVTVVEKYDWLVDSVPVALWVLVRLVLLVVAAGFWLVWFVVAWLVETVWRVASWWFRGWDA